MFRTKAIVLGGGGGNQKNPNYYNEKSRNHKNMFLNVRRQS